MVHDAGRQGPSRAAWAYLFVATILIVLRLPSLVQPAGGDQGLYAYSGQRLLSGDVPYRDMWDQKPPGVAFLYAGLLRIWPHESIVPLADIGAAILIAWLLVVLGRRCASPRVGYAASLIFLLFGDPSLQRLSGIYVRGQCEPFIALAVTAALVLLAAPRRRVRHLFVAGTCLAAAFWLKYNAATYALPVLVAAWLWRDRSPSMGRTVIRDVAWIAAGGGAVTGIFLIYFAIHGALGDLWLATIVYNLGYSNETYAVETSLPVPLYLLLMPVTRARVDFLWFLGVSGAAFLLWRMRASRAAPVVLAWLGAAVLSVAINGQRDLPNYFVQAFPALALAAAAGFAVAIERRGTLRFVALALILAGLWRVGVEPAGLFPRVAGLPGLIENVRYDLAYIQARIDRVTYRSRFKGQKFDAVEVEQLSRYIATTTVPSERVFVFGFLGGSVCWQSARESASRFFWSRPVIIEFARDRTGYGSAGLLADLEARQPVVVALQREQWESETFFMQNDGLRTWLLRDYVLDHQTAMFSVWRKKA